MQAQSPQEEDLLINQLQRGGRLVLTHEQAERRFKIADNWEVQLKKNADPKCKKCFGRGYLGVEKISHTVVICRCIRNLKVIKGGKDEGVVSKVERKSGESR